MRKLPFVNKLGNGCCREILFLIYFTIFLHQMCELCVNPSNFGEFSSIIGFLLFALNLLPIFLCRALGFILTVAVVFFALYVAGQILLLDVMIGVIVRVFIALKERALKLNGRLKSKPCLDILICRRERHIRGVGFGRSGEH